jgi:diguanylate cyclase (GGDEF)-like protein
LAVLGRWQRLRHSDQRVARDVRQALVATLFASPSSLAAGALSGSAISAVIGWSSHDHLLIYLGALISVVGAIRVASAMAYRDTAEEQRNAGARNWERLYEFGAWSFAAMLGLLTYLTITREPDIQLHMLAAATTTGYAAGISGRNAGRPAIAIGQLSLAAVPLTAALVQSGNLACWTLAFANILFIVAMLEITLRTYQVVLTAMSAAHSQAQLAQRFERLAQIDSLTGLRNRFALKSSLDRLLELGGGADSASLLWIDLDRFKEVNDTLGHPVGDQLLRVVAERLQVVVHEQDCLARFGGDEFVLLAAGTNRRDAKALADRILGLFATPFVVDGAALHVSASIGIVTVPHTGLDAEILLKYADMALYHAKTTGRNASCEFEPAMQHKLMQMRETEESLRIAIERHELELYYQPILTLGSSQVTCCEALIRWHHPTRGLVSPAEFIPLAERTGQIADITAWVLGEACRTARTWPHDIRVAVNISPMLLKRADLLQSVMTALIDSGLPANRLELEITESVFMDDSEQSNTMLKALRRIGARLALDDFGTGYSSLAYLHKYAFDKIKIDSSFVRNLEESRTARAIVNAVVSLARTLDVETVAEGVETASQLDQVRELGCGAVQGFFLSMPIPAAELAALLEQGVVVPAKRAPMLRLARKAS